MNFQEELLAWYGQHQRALPWRDTTDAYIIWLSEVILQQTRVEQGLPYFYKFLERFPTVRAFAAASEDEVLKLWQGLGYYSRGRNMLKTAIQVVDENRGVFPVRYEELLALKGIGSYTAAAISSFAANERRAVVDGNVIRVLARYFGVEEPVNRTDGKKKIDALAAQLIEGQPAALYNQAIMEFGALQCTPRSPNCADCVLRMDCRARIEGLVSVLPKKLKKASPRRRWFVYFILRDAGGIFIRQRQAGDIWEKLYDLPLLEYSSAPEPASAHFMEDIVRHFGAGAQLRLLHQQKQVLSHQIIYAQFFALENYMINFSLQTGIKSVTLQEFKDLAHPKLISDFLTLYTA